jgi:small multidrug resistance family-3 protein
MPQTSRQRPWSLGILRNREQDNHHDASKGMRIAKTFMLFILTACAEIVGCYLPYLWLKQNGSVWFLVPAACSLALFVWLLSLHPTAAGRVYAAYGGVYVSVAILWLWLIDAVRPTLWDCIGVAVALLGMAIIMLAAR